MTKCGKKKKGREEKEKWTRIEREKRKEKKDNWEKKKKERKINWIINWNRKEREKISIFNIQRFVKK